MTEKIQASRLPTIVIPRIPCARDTRKLRFSLRDVKARIIFAAFALLVFCVSPPTRAQNPDSLMPDASAAKSKAVLQQAIDALGGPVYLNVHDSDCTAHVASFEHSGESAGTVDIHVQRQYPYKTRIEYHGNNYITDIFLFELHGKGVITNVYTPDAAWTIRKDGVSDQTQDVVSDYMEQLRTDTNTILRERMNDASLIFRYAGVDTVDLKQADWIEIADHEGHTIRIAIDQKTRYPLRSEVRKRDPETRDQITRTTIYSNYQVADGIPTPWQLTRLQNDWLAQQTFYDGCHYDVNLPDYLFIHPAPGDAASPSGKKKK